LTARRAKKRSHSEKKILQLVFFAVKIGDATGCQSSAALAPGLRSQSCFGGVGKVD